METCQPKHHLYASYECPQCKQVLCWDCNAYDRRDRDGGTAVQCPCCLRKFDVFKEGR